MYMDNEYSPVYYLVNGSDSYMTWFSPMSKVSPIIFTLRNMVGGFLSEILYTFSDNLS